MHKIALTILLAVSLTACGEKEAPPKPKPVAVKKVEAPVDPQVAEQKRLEEVQKRVMAVTEIIKVKHKELASLNPPINEIALNSTSTKGLQYLYEIVSPEGVFYTNASVDYILLGNLLLGENKEIQNVSSRPALQELLASVREKSVQSQGNDMFGTLQSQADALSYTYGTGENQIVVFEDPDCPACQKLHKNLEGFAEKMNMSIKVFPYVLASKHPNGIARAKALFCAADPSAMWKKWMLEAEGKKDMDALWTTFVKTNNLQVSDCPKATFVDNWQKIGVDLGLTATPTIMFKTGLLAEGSMDEKSFTEAFDVIKKQEAQQALEGQPTTAPAVAPSSTTEVDSSELAPSSPPAL